MAKDTASSDLEFDEILSLDIADLVVTSAAKRQQKLTDAPAAIYVITQEQIRRAGVTTIPEALRLVPGVQVAKLSSNKWAISARGFNGGLSDKLQVLIDGRSIYTPVFSGVYWDDQGTMIQDIDRIEVIRGPGASLYGANAVNGVINIITKSAQDTKGNLVSATGSFTGGLLEARHGGDLNDNAAYRVYGQYLNSGKTQNLSGDANHDDWYRGRSGFRIDGKRDDGDTYTLQGDAYGGREDTQATQFASTAPLVQTVFDTETSYGGNVLARWNHNISRDSQLSVQAYIDHYSRLEINDEQHVSTVDIQMQHNLRVNDRDNFIWGGGARDYVENIVGSFSSNVQESYADHYILNTFAQNEYALVPEVLFLTVGSKFEYNDFTGFEVEPTARLSWHPADNQTLWTAVSRAVRTPSSIEDDVNVAFAIAAGPPVTVSRVFGNSNQDSEELIAYEAGYRIQPTQNISFDTSVFYNDYSHLLAIGPQGTGFFEPDGTFVQPYVINNLGAGHTYGLEFTANWNVTQDWRLAGSYTLLRMNLNEPPTDTLTLEAAESNAPQNQFAVQSYYNLTDDVHWDNMFYYVDGLRPPIGSYLRYDTRLAWLAMPGVELSLIGKNLLDPEHPEFPVTPEAEIGRSIVGQIQWKF